MKRILRILVWLIAMALWCASCYFLLSTRPNFSGFQIPEHGVHTVMFFGLAFMTTCAQLRPNTVLTLAALYFFGGMTEVAQHFSPPRTCDLLDFIEDIIGSTVGLFAALACMALLRQIFRFVQTHLIRSETTVPHVS